MALTTNYSAELNAGASNACIIGDGTPYDWMSVDGLGTPDVRSFDTVRGSRDGDTGGADRSEARVIRFGLEVVDDGTFAADFRLLKQAWRTTTTDTTLDVKHPAFQSTDNILRFYGRPRGLSADILQWHNGVSLVTASFKCLDPFGYGAAETVTDSSSPASVTNNGDVPSDRFTITITGNGGTPIITSTTDEAAAVVFNTTLAGTAVLDFRAHTMTVGGTAVYQLAAGSRWFRLLAGANTLTFSGCASIEVVHRPAYL